MLIDSWTKICVNKRGLVLSKKVLWVYVGQREAELPAIKVGGLKKKSATWLGTGESGSNWAKRKKFF